MIALTVLCYVCGRPVVRGEGTRRDVANLYENHPEENQIARHGRCAPGTESWFRHTKFNTKRLRYWKRIFSYGREAS